MGLLTYILIFVVALTVLLIASDKFIESAEKIGLSFGISPFVIGVTIVAFGTSLPELATSIACVFSGTSEIVAGNVIGSNITNILLVLGLTVVIGKQIVLDFDIMDTDMPLLIGSSFFLYFVIADQQVSIIEAGIFLAALVVFLMNSFGNTDNESSDVDKVEPKQYLFVILGALFVFLGAKYTIFAIEQISLIAEISPDIIALTGVAIGTSLPEVIVSISAAKKGKHAIAVGNVLGSNLFNTFAVMSIPRFFGDLTISDLTVEFSAPFMVAVSFMFLMVPLSRKINRTEGYILLLFYVFFIYSLVKLGMT